MQIFNTLTRQKEEFVPQVPGEYRIYVCGPTVYNYIHIGNARPLIVFDTLRRYLEYRGNKVIYVSNITDIDDKLIKKGQEEGTSMKEVAQRFEAEYLKDAAGLVKMYAMVNVSQYQIVATGGSVAECESNYRQMLARYNLIDPADTEPSASDQGEVTGVIADLRSAVMDGNTWYYLQLSDGTVYYTISAAEAPEAVILNVGDTVTVKYAEGEGSILQAYSVAKAVPAA